MIADQIVLLLEAIHAKKIHVKHNGWVECCCPLAKWTHDKGTDHTPSFGVSVNDQGTSYYKCFSCKSGTLEHLIQTLEYYNKGSEDYDFGNCYKILANQVDELPLPEYDIDRPVEQAFEEWPSYWLDLFMPAQNVPVALEYLQSRNLTVAEIQSYQLRYDHSKDMVVCPYYNVFGKFAGARGRSIFKGVEGWEKHYAYKWNGKDNTGIVWFNETCLNLPGPVVVVEGQFDCFNVLKVYPKTVANLTALPRWAKMKKLGDCPLIIQIPDNNKAGELSIEKYYEFSKKIGVAFRVLHLDHGVVDAGECHSEYLKDKILQFI